MPGPSKLPSWELCFVPHPKHNFSNKFLIARQWWEWHYNTPEALERASRFADTDTVTVSLRADQGPMLLVEEPLDAAGAPNFRGVSRPFLLQLLSFRILQRCKSSLCVCVCVSLSLCLSICVSACLSVCVAASHKNKMGWTAYHMVGPGAARQSLCDQHPSGRCASFMPCAFVLRMLWRQSSSLRCITFILVTTTQ
eukprot:676961-Rhodomonas_salina.1